MEASVIERMEKVRFNVMLLQIISFGIWFTGMILIQLPLSRPVFIVCNILSPIFGLFFIYATIKNFLLCRKVKNDKELVEALGNEMYQSFDYKAKSSGLYATILCVMFIFVANEYLNWPVKIYCMVTILVAVITVGVHRLLLYK